MILPSPSPTASGGERVFVLWFPDWPVKALTSELEQPADAPPVALVARRLIVACCERARTHGVRAGMRERDAQAACPSLELHPHDPDRDARRFAPVTAALEDIVAGVETRRPGLAAMRARGPARYYGGEEPAAHALLARAHALGFGDARVGVADGLFTAEQAARTPTGGPITAVPVGGSRGFLAPLPITRAADARLATTLQGLGIHTLGALAALPDEAVRQRFGLDGVAAHRRASAAGPQHGSDVRPRTPPKDLAVGAEFEPPLNAVALLAEAASATVTGLFAGLTEAALICTGLRVELTDDAGARHERTWSHPSRFAPEDVLDRVRWQAESGVLGGGGEFAGDDDRGGGVVRIRITPTHTGRAAAHAAGLWGGEPDERVRHHLRGIQAAHGRDSVGTAALRGGRLAADRQLFTPWGSAETPMNVPAGLPWPGALTGPSPSLVFAPPLPASLIDAKGDEVLIDAEDLLSSSPARLSVRAPKPGAKAAAEAEATATAPAGASPRRVWVPRHLPHAAELTSWSSPWPIRERWWEGRPAQVRLQVTLATGDAWLLLFSQGEWLAEGRYD